MLKTHLNTLPYTKFVIIEDSVTAKGGEILSYLLKNHEKRQDYRTHYFIFGSSFKKIKEKHPNCVCHDFTSDVRNWYEPTDDFKASSLTDNCVIVVDSLVHVIYRYGLAEAYHIFNEIKNKANVQQIVTVLHTDLLEDRDKVVQYFQHLATLHMELDTKRVSYTYKKGHRKIIKQIEEYCFENGKFSTESIKKPDKKSMEQVISQVVPENLSTFRISLNEKEKESRNNLVLPYLPKDGEESSEGKIHYALDEIDDWDEEDPDDDLDI